MIKEFFHSQGNFSQIGTFSAKRFFDYGHFSQKVFFPWLRKFSINKEFSRNKTFSLMKEVFHKQRFLHSQNFLQTKIKKKSLKSKILDPCNTKSYAKISLTHQCLLVTKGHTYFKTISFLSMCELLLLNIKKLILDNNLI